MKEDHQETLFDKKYSSLLQEIIVRAKVGWFYLMIPVRRLDGYGYYLRYSKDEFVCLLKTLSKLAILSLRHPILFLLRLRHISYDNSQRLAEAQRMKNPSLNCKSPAVVSSDLLDSSDIRKTDRDILMEILLRVRMIESNLDIDTWVYVRGMLPPNDKPKTGS